MDKTFILLLMIFLHIVDDFYLQGILAKLKQKDFWREFGDKYKYDYIIALLMHGFSWTFMIMLPVAYYYNFQISDLFILMFMVNMGCHAGMDNNEANEKTVGLITDQLYHFLQVMFTWWVFI